MTLWPPKKLPRMIYTHSRHSLNLKFKLSLVLYESIGLLIKFLMIFMIQTQQSNQRVCSLYKAEQLRIE